jgi:retron-type reverse transcriptase
LARAIASDLSLYNEDKIVQGATVLVLNAIYEGDFVGFSYGFRPRRGPHDALDALSTAITHPSAI